MPLSPGSRLDAYEIVRPLGSGGMGEVWLATEVRLGRKVAVKLLPADLTRDPLRVQRFEQEARAASALSHPNVCHIYAFGETQDGQYYLGMELVEGETLRQRLTTRRLPIPEVLDIGLQVAAALTAAHAAGITHRDIKPENVMVRPDGLVKVLDFGLAKLTPAPADAAGSDNAPTLLNTDAGIVVGTAAYMAPEQARGQQVDARTDIWSLGVLLYEMAAGHRPFAGTTNIELSSAVLRDPPSPLPAHVPVTLARVVEKCLAKDPGQRYQQASEVRAALEVSPADSVSDIHGSLPLSRARRRVIGWATLATVILGAGIFGLSSWSRQGGSRFGNPTSLAILPLINATGNATAEYLSEGISDALINSLSQLPQLRVMARGTVFSYKGKEIDPRKIGQDLNVHVVFSGRLTQQNDTTIIQANLANADDGTQIWGERYARTLADLPELQDGIAADLLQQLHLQLTGEQRHRFTKQHTDNAAAYRLLLEGRYHSNRLTIEGLKRGIELMQRAIELEPTYALAYAGLADAYADASGVYLSVGEAMPRVRAAAEHALRLDGTLAEAHALLGYIKGTQDWRWTEAEQELQRTIALRPSYARAYEAYGHILMIQGHADAAIAAMTRARDLDPLSDLINANLGWFYYLARRYQEALAWSRRLVELDPKLVAAHYNLGMVYGQIGRHSEAVAAFQAARDLDPTNWPTSALLCHEYASGGDRERAQQLLPELMQQAMQGRLDPAWIGLIYTALGDKDHAFIWLEKAYRLNSDTLLFLKVDPKYDSLHSDPRYSDMVKRLKLRGPESRLPASPGETP
jgi:eukaryotic-like serine/threonine-protein kinase